MNTTTTPASKTGQRITSCRTCRRRTRQVKLRDGTWHCLTCRCAT